MKMMKKRFLSILLSLVMVVGLMPGMGMTAYATTVTERDVRVLLDNLYNLSMQKLQEDDIQAAFALHQAFEALGDAYNNSAGIVDSEVEAAYDSALAVYQQYSGGGGHTHSWNYQANGASVTATCTGNGDCDYKTNGVTLTISAPANLECDGSAKAAAISGSIPEGQGLAALPSITYDSPDGQAPSTPGTYKASFIWGGANAFVNFTLTAPAHTHSWSYQASGATITATCSEANCTLTDSKATLTIAAPTLTTYGETGKSEAATLTGLDAFNSATDLTVAASDIKYYGVKEDEIEGHTYKKQGDELAQVPTAAGEYVAGLTLSNVKTSETETGDVIARVWYTIAPASISSVTVTDITAPVATEALDTEAATSTANVTLGAVTWNPTTTPAAYATVYTATVAVTASENYAFADEVTATMNGEAATVTKNEDGTLSISYTFTKTALNPVTITATDKEATWSSDGIAIPVEGMFTIPDEAGDASYTVTANTGAGTYNAETGKLTVTTCGTFTVTVSTAATETHAAATANATLTVKTKAMTVSAEDVNVTVDGQPHGITLTVTDPASGATVKYGTEAGSYTLDESPTQTEVGEKTVYYQVTADNYTTYTGNAKVTVNAKQTQTITASDVTATYGDTGKKIEATTSGDGALSYAVKSGDAVTIDPSSGALTIVKVGTATITVTAAETETYAAATMDVTVTVVKADASPAISDVALPYTGQPQELVTAGTVSGGTLEYALGTDANTAPADGWSTEIPSGTESGKYFVWYRVLGDENHNGVDPACIVVTIAEPTSQETPVATPAAPESVSDYTLLASMKTSGNKALKLKWTAVTGAEGYDVFFGDCGGGECTLEKTVTGTSCKIGKLKKGNAYKAFVKAWRTENGQKVYIGEASPDVHAVAGGKSNKYTNAKKITVKKKKLTVAVGGSKKIKASLKKFSNSRRYLNHTAKIRYFSSNRAVATVNAKGKVTGVAPGTCTVYAVAENGLRKGVKITVK